MDAQNALKMLTTLGIEYAQSMKDRPATQDAILRRVQELHMVLQDALNPKDAEGAGEHDGDPQ